ncbi:hypothetical protein [Amycolatopsis cihanbeyliensis]|uniref:Uncharacterized protein n=1 Tax=Amycolatopsis cihanbeyliensis TaxID=1128664 RepID=A0A542DDB8_AMYCI|nr:hypothetical protein [Amycolatopsis cihanbeyliensis]TQJ01069.1 hypothetical protein FB471_0733 [Amycolatopsis cihanbeyliensis]
MTEQEGTSAGETEGAELAAACEQLQGELDEMLDSYAVDGAVDSLDTAVASFKEVEQRNVSSVQLVALDGR